MLTRTDVHAILLKERFKVKDRIREIYAIIMEKESSEERDPIMSCLHRTLNDRARSVFRCHECQGCRFSGSSIENIFKILFSPLADHERAITLIFEALIVRPLARIIGEEIKETLSLKLYGTKDLDDVSLTDIMRLDRHISSEGILEETRDFNGYLRCLMTEEKEELLEILVEVFMENRSK